MPGREANRPNASVARPELVDATTALYFLCKNANGTEPRRDAGHPTNKDLHSNGIVAPVVAVDVETEHGDDWRSMLKEMRALSGRRLTDGLPLSEIEVSAMGCLQLRQLD